MQSVHLVSSLDDSTVESLSRQSTPQSPISARHDAVRSTRLVATEVLTAISCTSSTFRRLSSAELCEKCTMSTPSTWARLVHLARKKRRKKRKRVKRVKR